MALTMLKSKGTVNLGNPTLRAARSAFGQPALLLEDAGANRQILTQEAVNDGVEHPDRDAPFQEFIDLAKLTIEAAKRGSRRIGHTSTGDGATKIPIGGHGQLLPPDPQPEPSPVQFIIPKSITPDELRRRFPELQNENSPFRPFEGLFDFAGSRITLGVIVFAAVGAFFLFRR